MNNEELISYRKGRLDAITIITKLPFFFRLSVCFHMMFFPKKIMEGIKHIKEVEE